MLRTVHLPSSGADYQPPPPPGRHPSRHPSLRGEACLYTLGLLEAHGQSVLKAGLVLNVVEPAFIQQVGNECSACSRVYPSHDLGIGDNVSEQNGRKSLLPWNLHSSGERQTITNKPQ